MNINELNNDFAIDGSIRVVEGKNGFPFIEVENQAARAVISLYGGQLLSYKKSGKTELVFLSELAHYRQGKAIKGGVPVCWPWFGDDPEGKGRAAHGFVRNMMWRLEATEKKSENESTVVMSVSHNDATLQLWPYKFKLSVEITVSGTLGIKLITHNTDNVPFQITQALHTYFSVADINAVKIQGFDGITYIDKVESNHGEKEKTQAGEITFNAEVDRIYQDVSDKFLIKDAAGERNIQVTTAGSKTAVVWNPWIDICRNMDDLKNDDFKRFVCLETTNAAKNKIDIKPAAKYELQAEYSYN